MKNSDCNDCKIGRLALKCLTIIIVILIITIGSCTYQTSKEFISRGCYEQPNIRSSGSHWICPNKSE